MVWQEGQYLPFDCNKWNREIRTGHLTNKCPVGQLSNFSNEQGYFTLVIKSYSIRFEHWVDSFFHWLTIFENLLSNIFCFPKIWKENKISFFWGKRFKNLIFIHFFVFIKFEKEKKYFWWGGGNFVGVDIC